MFIRLISLPMLTLIYMRTKANIKQCLETLIIYNYKSPLTRFKAFI